MPTNFYFQSGNTSGTTNEQRLVEDLVIESLKIYGHDVYYLPRTIANQDPIFGEDPLSYFSQFYPLEMYLENVEGFEGEGDLFTKFGFEFRASASFVVSKRRWEESVASNAENLQLTTRPSEGDILYFPKTKTFFEIKFVDFLNPFYQLGKINVFKLKCEVFEYSSERFITGNPEIDVIDDKSQDQYAYQFLLNDGFNLLLNSGDSLILGGYSVTEIDPLANNEDYDNIAYADGILDFTSINPFGEVLVRK
jgi:hypothetical protein